MGLRKTALIARVFNGRHFRSPASKRHSVWTQPALIDTSWAISNSPPTRRAHRVRLSLPVNYSWQWDLAEAVKFHVALDKNRSLWPRLGSAAVRTIDVVLRWEARSRLSGFLPVQSAYADLAKQGVPNAN
jgi:hypothetical protein